MDIDDILNILRCSASDVFDVIRCISSKSKYEGKKLKGIIKTFDNNFHNLKEYFKDTSTGAASHIVQEEFVQMVQAKKKQLHLRYERELSRILNSTKALTREISNSEAKLCSEIMSNDSRFQRRANNRIEMRNDKEEENNIRLREALEFIENERREKEEFIRDKELNEKGVIDLEMKPMLEEREQRIEELKRNILEIRERDESYKDIKLHTVNIDAKHKSEMASIIKEKEHLRRMILVRERQLTSSKAAFERLSQEISKFTNKKELRERGIDTSNITYNGKMGEAFDIELTKMRVTFEDEHFSAANDQFALLEKIERETAGIKAELLRKRIDSIENRESELISAVNDCINDLYTVRAHIEECRGLQKLNLAEADALIENFRSEAGAAVRLFLLRRVSAVRTFAPSPLAMPEAPPSSFVRGFVDGSRTNRAEEEKLLSELRRLEGEAMEMMTRIAFLKEAGAPVNFDVPFPPKSTESSLDPLRIEVRDLRAAVALAQERCGEDASCARREGAEGDRRLSRLAASCSSGECDRCIRARNEERILLAEIAELESALPRRPHEHKTRLPGLPAVARTIP